MARIPYFDAALAEGRAKKHFDRLPALNIFKMLGHSGELFDGVSNLGGQILNLTELDPVLREIAIIRVGVLCGSAYEAYQHRRIGRWIGMSEALLDGIDQGPDAEVFTPLQRQVMALADDIVANVRASDVTFDPLCEALGYKQIQELVITIGYYMMVCCFLETFDVEIETNGVEPRPDQMPGAKRT